MTPAEAQQMARDLALSHVKFHRAADDDYEERAIKENGAKNAALRAAPKASALSKFAVSFRLCCCAYGGPAAPLLETVASGAIAPIKASWLIALKERGSRLDARHELPPEAFFTVAELTRLVVAVDAKDVSQLFVAVSCPQLSVEHADPDGFFLNIVSNIAKLYLGRSGYYSKAPADKSPLAMAFRRAGLDERTADCAIMWPFASVHHEAPAHTTGRRAAAAWFADPASIKWIAEEVPAAASGGGMELHGAAHRPLDPIGPLGADPTWRLAEVLLSALPNVPERRLDLSKRSVQAMRKAYGAETRPPSEAAHTGAVGAARGIPLAINEDDRLDLVCASRPAPMTPSGYLRSLASAFDEIIRSDDAVAAAEVYSASFLAATESQSILNYGGLGWCKRQDGGSVTDRAVEVSAGFATSDDAVGGDGGDGVGTQLQALCEALPHYVALISLDLSGNAIDATGAAVLSTSLKRLGEASGALQSLSLSGNLIGPTGSAVVAPGLGQLAGLTYLDLSSNYLKDDGVLALVTTLVGETSRMTGLAELRLDTNEVRQAGALALAQLGSLKRLSLKDNLLKDEGAVALAAALANRGMFKKSGLQSLNVQKNGIGEEGARALEAARLESLTVGVLIKRY